MSIIGLDDIAGMASIGRGTSTPPQMDLAATIRTAVAGETADLAGFYLNSGKAGESVDVLLYDITGQTVTDPDGATLEATTTVSLTGSVGWHTTVMSFALTAGRDYAVAVGNWSADGISARRLTGLTSGDGAEGAAFTPADPWAGSASTSQYATYMSTTVAPSGPTITSTTDPAITGTALTIVGTFPNTITSVTQSIAGNDVSLTINSQSGVEVKVASAIIENTQLKYGTQTLTVTDNTAAFDTTTFSAIKSVDAIQPEVTDNGFNDLTSIATVGDLIAIPDLAINDQIAFGNVISLNGTPTTYFFRGNPDATFAFGDQAGPSEDIPDGIYTAPVRAWDASDQTWGTVGTETITVGDVIPGGGIRLPMRANIQLGIRKQ